MKNLQNLGKILNKQEQQSINGGDEGECPDHECTTDNDCPTNYPSCYSFNFTISCAGEQSTIRRVCMPAS